MDVVDESEFVVPGRIRKRRFSSARIQPTRVKKVMQSDEEIGRMVASVPVALGSAMEHFAEKVLESAAQCVKYMSARTLTPTHIKYAITRNRHFSFLEELTKDIPLPRFSEEPSTSGTYISTDSDHPAGDLTARHFFSQFYSMQQPQPQQQQQQQSQHMHYPLSVSLPPQTISFPQQQHLSYDLNCQLQSQQQNLVPYMFSTPGSDSAPVYTQNIAEQLPQSSQNISGQFVTKQVASSVATPTTDAEPVKRKRGRPRKEKVEKFVESTEDKSLFIRPPNGDVTTSNIGDKLTTAEEDRMLMPPPSMPLLQGNARRATFLQTTNSGSQEADSSAVSTTSSHKSLTAV